MWYALVIAAFLIGPAGPEAAGQPHLPPMILAPRVAFPSLQECHTALLNLETAVAGADGVDRARAYCVPISDPATENAS